MQIGKEVVGVIIGALVVGVLVGYFGLAGPLAGQVSQLQSQVSSLQSQLTVAQNLVTTLQTEKTSLLSQITNLTSRVSTLTSDKEALQLQISQLNSQISQLNSRVTQLTAKIAELNASLPYYSRGTWNVITTFSGSGSAKTSSFVIPHEQYRITATLSSRSTAPYLSISVHGLRPVSYDNMWVDNPGTDVSHFYNGPGEFYLDVSVSLDSTWQIRVEAWIPP